MDGLFCRPLEQRRSEGSRSAAETQGWGERFLLTFCLVRHTGDWQKVSRA
jgi:hypothetical protein